MKERLRRFFIQVSIGIVPFGLLVLGAGLLLPAVHVARRTRRTVAPVGRIWSTLTSPEAFPGWWPGVLRAGVVGTRAAGVGAVWSVVVRRPGMAAPVTLRLRMTAWKPDRRLAWTVPETGARFDLTLSVPEKGLTEIRFLGSHPIPNLLARVVWVLRSGQREEEDDFLDSLIDESERTPEIPVRLSLRSAFLEGVS
jgi:uncharacterized protein YndB with AHSA1/START domain